MTKSWKTSVFGAGGILTVVVGVVNALLDNDPATVPDWTTAIGTIVGFIGLLFARDNKVTSKQAGAE